jgi:hypothetical protein
MRAVEGLSAIQSAMERSLRVLGREAELKIIRRRTSPSAGVNTK